MNSNSPVIAEFQAQAMGILARAGSESATDYLRRSAWKRVKIDFDDRLVEATAWRVSVAGSVGLVSREFLAAVKQALRECWESETQLIEELLTEQSTSPIDEKEAERILRGFVSLDLEYARDTGVQLMSLHINSVVHPPGTIEVFVVERGITLPSAGAIPRRVEATAHIQKLFREFGDDMERLMLLAEDVSAYLETFESPGDTARIAAARFADLLSAAQRVKSHLIRNFEPKGSLLEEMRYLRAFPPAEQRSSDEGSESGSAT